MLEEFLLKRKRSGQAAAINQAIAGQPPSGYVTAAHLVTKQNIGADGGPQNIFDPDNGYRDKYKGIWGAM